MLSVAKLPAFGGWGWRDMVMSYKEKVVGEGNRAEESKGKKMKYDRQRG